MRQLTCGFSSLNGGADGVAGQVMWKQDQDGLPQNISGMLCPIEHKVLFLSDILGGNCLIGYSHTMFLCAEKANTMSSWCM
jgi:hypothetical protein